MLKGLNAIPKKVAKVKTELIDLDLIRGTAFTKAKSQQGWLSALFYGTNRVLLLPFYLGWWREQSSPVICALLLVLYILQVISLRIYFENGLSSAAEEFAEVPASEVLMPLVMMTILGVIHTQIVGTKSANKNQSYHSSKYSPNSQQTHKKKRKRKSRSNVEKSSHSARSTTDMSRAANRFRVSDEESGLGSVDLPQVKSETNNTRPLSQRRGQSSIESLNIQTGIPRIEIEEKISPNNTDLSSDEFDLESNNSQFWRRFSDSKSLKNKKRVSDDIDGRTRRYSEGSKARKTKPKLTVDFQNKTKKRKRFKTLHLSPPVAHLNHRECSSCESEGTLSPTTPNTPTPVRKPNPKIEPQFDTCSIRTLLFCLSLRASI